MPIHISLPNDPSERKFELPVWSPEVTEGELLKISNPHVVEDIGAQLLQKMQRLDESIGEMKGVLREERAKGEADSGSGKKKKHPQFTGVKK